MTGTEQQISFRPVRLGRPGLIIEHRPDGSILAQSPHALGAYPEKLTERLDQWAEAAPDRIFLAQRTPDHKWRTIGYADFRNQVRSLGQALLNRGLSRERPVAVLSGNDIEHALLLFAAMYVGVPYAPVSPAYSLAGSEFTRLFEILNLVRPGLIFVNDLASFARALHAIPRNGAELVTPGPPGDLPATSFRQLLETPASPAVDDAHARVNADTIAKILFTSGSTGHPKGVINTQRMLCSNQAMSRSMLAFLEEEPPVTLDWLPWHHTFGGNHNLGMTLYSGGSLYIDEGKPIPGGIAATARNLAEIAPTVYFNVPKGYEELIPYLKTDDRLREKFFSRLKLIFYAAASLGQPVWDELERLAIETCGERITILSGYGSTETAPFALCPVKPSRRAGYVGLPSPGIQMKLVPWGDKLEVRMRGPNVTPGYWKNEQLTRAAFDEEGFYSMHDALAFLDPENPEEGFVFDGRTVEDFKLSSGTWVSVGALRTRFVAHCAPYVQDVAIAGHDRDDIAVLIFPNLQTCCAAAGSPAESFAATILEHPGVRELFRQLLGSFAKLSTGSSNRIVRAMLLADRPSMEKNEVTDKGSLNQRAVLRERANLVEELYSVPLSARVINLEERN